MDRCGGQSRAGAGGGVLIFFFRAGNGWRAISQLEETLLATLSEVALRIAASPMMNLSASVSIWGDVATTAYRTFSIEVLENLILE